MPALFIPGHMVVYPTAVREEIIIDIHTGYQRTLVGQISFAEEVDDIPTGRLDIVKVLSVVWRQDTLGVPVSEGRAVGKMGFVGHAARLNGLKG